MSSPAGASRVRAFVRWLNAALLAAWAAVSFGACWFARDLQFVVGGWPFAYWLAAQGALLVFTAIVAAHAFVMNRLWPEDGGTGRASDG